VPFPQLKASVSTITVCANLCPVIVNTPEPSAVDHLGFNEEEEGGGGFFLLQ